MLPVARVKAHTFEVPWHALALLGCRSRHSKTLIRLGCRCYHSKTLIRWRLSLTAIRVRANITAKPHEDGDVMVRQMNSFVKGKLNYYLIAVATVSSS